jgi:F0F1-type ATP synthase membrane subunit c/vacuolar-type H+-ATPase subunit K
MHGYYLLMKKLLAILGAFLTGGLALVASSIAQSASAAWNN